MTLDLRHWISTLEKKDLLYREKAETDIRNCSKIIFDNYKKASLFERIAGYKSQLISNAVSSREMIAHALDTDEKSVLAEYHARISKPVRPSFSSSSDGECQEVIAMGIEKVDLSELPILLQHEFDGAPYISAGVVIAKDPENKDYNIGIYRLMYRKKNELGINITAPHRLRWFYQKSLDLKQPLEIAVCLGLHPLDLLAAVTTVPDGTNELDVWGGLRKEGTRMVKCKSVDLFVPSHAEIVLEGQMEPTGWTEPEGPYGEFPGTYSGMRKNPIFKVHALTSRHDFIYQSATHGGKHLAYSDFFIIIPQLELSMFQALRHAGVDVRGLRVLPSSAGMICFLSISQRIKGDSRNALHIALSGSRQNFPKYCIVVDSDIDIYDDNEVMWAIATRSQPKEDLIVLDGMRIPSSSDPSLIGPPYSMSKMGLDATIPTEGDRSRFEYSKPPSFASGEKKISKPSVLASTSDNIAEKMKELLNNSGPLFFYEVAKHFDSVDYRRILLSWSELRESNSIEQNNNGKYALKKLS